MTKTSNITYWVTTLWLALGMVSTGIVQLIRMDEEVSRMQVLGYPVYLLTLIGILKILGTAVVLSPKLPRTKEWAYAGFFFLMSGAIFSHIQSNSRSADLFGPILLLVLCIISWHFRPAERKLI